MTRINASEIWESILKFPLVLLAGAFLGAGCSDSTETTAARSPTPVPELTAEQKTAIKNSEAANKAAEEKKKEANAQSNADTLQVMPANVDTTAALETTDNGVKPTPKP
jgi:uncharacterized lipoprotein YajG